MESRDLVNSWLIQYGNKRGKYFRLGENGMFAVKDEQDQEYDIDVPDNSKNVYFCAPIVTLNDDLTKAKDMERILKWNLWGQETQGGTLSFEEDTNRIVFHKIFEVEKLDENSFEEEFNRFMQSVDHIVDLWKEYQQNGPKISANTSLDPMFRI